ncbi:MAG: type IV pilus twitching motility protein PilT [Nitrospiraceae bacterium]|nr:MAG: type IV pilus twitching motility protein PilT [Nitrospiraceae bacterium]
MIVLNDLLHHMIETHGSDLHLCAGSKPVVRRYGDLEEVGNDRLSFDGLREILFTILSKEQQQKFLDEKELDFAYEIPNAGRFRVNYYDQRKGMSAAFRIIPAKIFTPPELGLPKHILEFTNLPRGLVLVTGPTGSGKSTTLATLIDHINKTRKLHIITIEDPIEYVHENNRCLINQRELGSNTRSFARALRSALREDPDIILVGEMRDLETIELAITAAETGHLVFATLHTSSAPKTIDRIIDAFPSRQQSQIRTMLAGNLKGVICQHLLKRVDGKGMLPALEMLFCNFAVANLIRENKVHQVASIIQAGKQQGMMLMDDSIMEMLKAKKISPEEAFLKANVKKPFEVLINSDYRSYAMSL